MAEAEGKRSRAPVLLGVVGLIGVGMLVARAWSPEVVPPPDLSLRPRPLKEPAQGAASVDARRKSLRQQLRRLEKRLQEAKDRGEKTQAHEQQLQELTDALFAASTSEKLDALDRSIARLEREVP